MKRKYYQQFKKAKLQSINYIDYEAQTIKISIKHEIVYNIDPWMWS